MLQDHLDHGFPQSETRPRADVSTAFLALKNEPASTLLEESSQETRRRNVQISGDPLGLQLLGLIGPASGNNGEWRFVNADRFELLVANFGWHKTQDTDAPRTSFEFGFGLKKKLLCFGLPKQSKCQEGEGTSFGNSTGEGRR